MKQISGNKNELTLRAFNVNQLIYGANSSVDDDVKYDNDAVEDRKVPLIAEDPWATNIRKRTSILTFKTIN
jgi:hypothetical protein